ncbi:MAG: methyltransferase domain-containing protein [Patescibacteria group bacterium]
MADLQNGNELLKVDVFKKIGLTEGMKVGDLGCGNLAFYAFGAAKIVGKSGLVYAVDILKNVLNAVENRARQDGIDNLKTVWSNLEMVGATNIPAANLDAIFIHNVLFQSGEHAGFFKETARLLKAGGKLMIIDWKKNGAPFGPPIKDRPDPEAVKNLTAAAGFKLLEEFEAGPYHWGLLFSKN